MKECLEITMEPKIELYDLGRCTHKPIVGMYQFVVDNAERFVSNPNFAVELKKHAADRELPGYSIPQHHFTEMCRIWVDAHRTGQFVFDIPSLVFPDTAPRFKQVKEQGRNVGILTSGSAEFTRMLYGLPLPEGGILADYVNEYLLGEEIGDKDHAETFSRLWESRRGDIHAVFDDKVSVCEAAIEGFKQANGSASVSALIYLVDRKGKTASASGELADRVTALRSQGVRLIRSFEEAE